MKKKIFVLGGAQLGFNYGLKKINIYKNKKQLKNILKIAKDNNINFIDTARTYGNSEKNTGEFNKNLSKKDKFKVISKLGKIKNIKQKNLYQKVLNSVLKSHVFLGQKKIDILLIHDFKNLLYFKKSLITVLEKLIKKKLVGEIGVSVYNPKEAIHCLQYKLVKHIQIPFNILDQRWLNSKFILEINKRNDVKIHVRSIFLKGLLLDKQKYWPKWSSIQDEVSKKMNICAAKLKKINKIELCISYVKSFSWVKYIIIGIDSTRQIQDIAKFLNCKKMNSKEKNYTRLIMKDLIVDNKILSPNLW